MPLNLRNRWWPGARQQSAPPVMQAAEAQDPLPDQQTVQAMHDLQDMMESAESGSEAPQRILAFMPLSRWMAKVRDAGEPGTANGNSADAAHTPPISARTQ